MGITLLRASEHRRVPWRNGQGSTAEILSRSGPDQAFDWRLSIATIDSDAGFSQFQGIDRSLMALSPSGVELATAAGRVVLRQFDVHRFAGEDAVSAANVRLPTLDLNLMTRRERCSGSLTVEHPLGDWSVELDGSSEGAVVLLEGRVYLGAVKLEQCDAVSIGRGSRLSLEGEGVLAMAQVRLSHPAG